jgi:predicted transposase YdaD
MIDHDRLFKELLTLFFADFIELFFPAVAAYVQPDSVTFLDKELFTDISGGERREADVVVRAQFRNRPAFFLIHVEHQAVAQPEFSGRMFRYFTRLYEKYALPVYPIVLFSYDSPVREEPNTHRVAFPDLTVLDFTYRVIQLNHLSWRDFVRKPNPVASALMAKMGIAAQERPKVKLECLRLLATLRLDPAKSYFISGFIDTYLRLTAQELPIFQAELEAIMPAEKERVMQLTTSWKEEGLQQGEANLLMRQLTRRFGVLDRELEARIRALPVAQLEALGEALFDFAGLADVTAWIDRHAPAVE